VTNTESPIVVVLSGSMEPAYYKGDLLFLTAPRSPIDIGDVCVFKIQGADIPIVHRVLETHKEAASEELLLTKGDNNSVNDRGLYNRGQLWVRRSDVVGCVKLHIPYLGMPTILMNESPKVKFAVLGLMAVYTLLNREET